MANHYYTTLQAVRRQAQIGANEITQDEELVDWIADASAWIDNYCGQHFDPRIYTKGLNGEVGSVNPLLFLKALPLLAITTLKNGDGSTIASANYTTLPKYDYPKTHVRLTVGNSWLTPNQTDATCPSPAPVLDSAYAVDALEITGTWGFHTDYDNAWEDSGSTLGAAVSTTTATQITLDSLTDDLDVGHLIRIDSEWLYVVGPVEATLTAITRTVKRGVNGSTAATHLSGSTVYVYRPESRIELATRMLVAAMFEAEANATGEVLNVSGMGTVSTSDVPKKVKAKLVAPYWNWMYGESDV